MSSLGAVDARIERWHRAGNRLIRRHIRDLPLDLQLATGFYPEVVQLPFGCERRDLLVPGMYAVVDIRVGCYTWEAASTTPCVPA